MPEKPIEKEKSAKPFFPHTSRSLRYIKKRAKRFVALFITVSHVVGAFTSVQAVMETRTSQGATAWAISLNTFPYIAVPAYWVFGRSTFDGYVNKRRDEAELAAPVVGEFLQKADAGGFLAGQHNYRDKLLERLAKLPATRANDVELLIDGDEIFSSIFAGIGAAQQYLLIQFYIVRNDELGGQLKEKLIAASHRGVKVRFIYDEIGSIKLPRSYLAELRTAGVDAVPFNSRKGFTNRFQINFRNHRKMVVADGRTAWVGGANVGDEYKGKHPTLTPWRDTMIKLTGPAVQTIQVSFLEDWYWATDRLLELEWQPEAAASGADLPVLCLPSGPADRFETCVMYFLHLINSSKERIWIASPYFVPDEQTVSALKLAALRGVEVRILMADKSDSKMVDLSGWAFADRLREAGVEVHRHENGFMHQKVILVDQDIATVGTANFDNRSFRLNFEITIEIRDLGFAKKNRNHARKRLRRLPPHQARRTRQTRLPLPLRRPRLQPPRPDPIISEFLSPA